MNRASYQKGSQQHAQRNAPLSAKKPPLRQDHARGRLRMTIQHANSGGGLSTANKLKATSVAQVVACKPRDQR